MRYCITAVMLLTMTAQLRASDAKLRIGVIGLVHGHVHGFFNRALKRPDIEIVGIAEPDRSLFERYAAEFHLNPKLLYTNADEMLQRTRPEAAVLYTSTYGHRAAIESCARFKVPAMMEKPLAVSVAEAQAIRRAAQQSKIPVLVNYETTWYPSNRAVYDLVREGALGPVRKVVVHDGHEGPKEIHVPPEFFQWLTDPKLNGAGALFDFGCYGADLMTWLMNGQAPETVTAITQRFKPEIYPRVDDEATIILTYPKAQAILQASWNWPFGRKDMEVYGETGYAITVHEKDLRIRLDGDKHERGVEAKPVAAPEDDSLNYLAAVVRGQIQPSGLSSLQTNMVVTEILDAARRSAETGRAVNLKSVRSTTR
jgi:predicted dehydrogenase